MKQKVALVLASGSARGLAHIGVIEELIKHDFEISSISGSSIGAMVGGLYACGKMDDFKNWICNIDAYDVFEIMDFTWTMHGFIKADNFFKQIGKYFNNYKIEELPIPLSIIATDIDDKKEICFTKGSLLKAVRASVSIPSVITPVSYNGHFLVDGGVISPIPIARVKRTPGDILMVVDIKVNMPYEKPVFEKEPKIQKAPNLKREVLTEIKRYYDLYSEKHNNKKYDSDEAPNYIHIIDKVMEIMQDQICDLVLEHHKPDFKVQISRDICASMEFHKAQEIIEAGRVAFKKAYNEYLQNNK